MNKATYTISYKAIADLEEIWIFTFKNWSEEQADRYFNSIIEEIEYICKNTESGKTMNHIKKGYKVSKVKSHLIFYRKAENNIIEIIRILHERMDIKNRLND